MKSFYELLALVSALAIIKFSFSICFICIFEATRIIDNSCAHITEFNLAIRLNRIDYAKVYLLNHDTIIHWTVRYLVGFHFSATKNNLCRRMRH